MEVAMHSGIMMGCSVLGVAFGTVICGLVNQIEKDNFSGSNYEDRKNAFLFVLVGCVLMDAFFCQVGRFCIFMGQGGDFTTQAESMEIGIFFYSMCIPCTIMLFHKIFVTAIWIIREKLD